MPVQYFTVSGNGVEAFNEAPPQRPDHGFVWCDVSPEAVRSCVEPIQRLTGVTIFENHLLDAENQQHPSYFDSTRHYEMVVFRGLDMTLRPLQSPASVGAEKADKAAVPLQAIKVKTRPTVFFLLPGALLTVRHDSHPVIPQIRDRLISPTEGRQRLPSSPEDLMLRILNGMVDRYLELRQPLTDQLEYWQQQLMNPRRPFRDWMLLLDARAETHKLELLCEEQLDAIQEWRDERLETIGPSPLAHRESPDAERAQSAASATSLLPLTEGQQVRANDLVEHIHRVLNHARRLEHSVESAVQLHFSATAHRTNEIIRTLTTITAIFMPLTLITGIFGMNFDAMPGLHSPIGFWLTMAGMLLVVVVLLVIFRRKHYLMRDSTGRSRRF